MNSHERICIIEVMGRHCGDIALYAGVNGGAEVIICPEHPISMRQVVDKLTKSRRSGKRSGIIVLSEGAGKADAYVEELSHYPELNVRAMVLGHILRGGGPTAYDRLFGTRCGARAVELLKAGASSRAIGLKDGQIYDIDITEAFKLEKKFNLELYKLANIVSL